MEKIAIFSGNRADFGILFPLIYSLNSYYQIELILSGAHVLKQWETRKDVERQLYDNNIYCNITEISLEDGKGTYKKCLSEIYLKIIDFFEIIMISKLLLYWEIGLRRRLLHLEPFIARFHYCIFVEEMWRRFSIMITASGTVYPKLQITILLQMKEAEMFYCRWVRKNKGCLI